MNTLKEIFVTTDGGLTTSGYIACIAAAIIAFVLAVFFIRKNKNEAVDVRKLVVCGVCIALGYVLSFVKIIPLPFGGSATLCSMLFIVLVGYFYGAGTGILVAFVYGMLQFLQGPYILSAFQVCCDYLFAFACLGLSGFFRKKENGLILGYIVAILARGAFHSLGGYLYWMEYMPDNFPAEFAWIYPVVYNYMYILAEGLITVIVLCLKPVKNAIAEVRKTKLTK